MVNESPSVRSLFEEAVELNAVDRAAFLDAACAGQAMLRAEIESLLRAHGDAGSFLGEPAFPGWNSADLKGSAEGHGAQIGPYKLREKIGEGGMGVVYLAEQTEPVKRKVAIKLIKPGMDSRQVVARFEAERQALAMMDHPNIAHVFDGGSASVAGTRPKPWPAAGSLTGSTPATAGQPYFVMELVQGPPITEYCDQLGLSTRQRLQLFLQVCQAVQHAHHKGIIHRDLKPSNVLVPEIDGTAVPKVIDFGVAKAVNQEITEQTLYTQFSQLVGTPLYMSPEQAGLGVIDVDTRSDIYSLGVLLYELLTGATPFDGETLKRAGLDEMRRIIREDEPPKPSAIVSTLNALTLSTVAQRRSSDPRKLSASLTGELDWIVMKALEKDRGRRYQSASGFGADIERYLADEPVEACPPTSAYRVRKFVRRNQGAVVAVGLILAALIAGITGTTLGLIDARKSRMAEANQRRIAEANEQEALAAAAAEREARRSAQERTVEAQAILDFVESHILAALGPEGEHGGLGRDVTLRQAIDSAVPVVETSFQNDPHIESALRQTLGIAFFNLGEYETAAKQFDRARRLYAHNRGADHSSTLLATHNLANCYAELDRYREALVLREEVLAFRKANLGSDHPDTLDALRQLADCYAGLGRHAEALKIAEATFEQQKATLGLEHRGTLLSSMSVANRYEEAGRHDDALKLREDTLERLKAQFGPNSRLALLNMTNLGNSYLKVGRHADAVRLYKAVLTVQEAKLGRDHPDTLRTMQQLANGYHALGQHADALKLNEETLARNRDKFGPSHPNTLLTMGNLSLTYSKLGRLADALTLREDLLIRQEATLGPNHPQALESKRLVANWQLRRLPQFRSVNDASGCRDVAEKYEQCNLTDAGGLYNAACLRAVTAAAVKLDPQTPTEDADRLAQEEADRAMAWLEQSISAGWSDVGFLKRDSDLDALRDRQDFQQLVAQLQAEQNETGRNSILPEQEPEDSQVAPH